MKDTITLEDIRGWARSVRLCAANAYLDGRLDGYTRAYLGGRIDMLSDLPLGCADDYILIGLCNEINHLFSSAARARQ